MRLILGFLIVGSVLACSGLVEAQAQASTEPSISWNDSTRLALGQCYVAENRWRNRTEHAAMAYVLLRRWRRYLRMHPGSTYSFEDQIRDYCAVHRTSSPSPHQTWVRALPWGTMETNPGMDPEQTDWRNWVDDWDYARETVTLFETGALRDPLPGAMNWGSTDDGNPHRGIPMPRVIASVVDDGFVLLNNHFYALDQDAVRCYRPVMMTGTGGSRVQVYTADRCRD